MATECCTAHGKTRGRTVIKLFIDVVQAFPSLVVSLILKLDERMIDTRQFLEATWFISAEVQGIIDTNADVEEWGDASKHVQAVLAGFQEDQWMAVDPGGVPSHASSGTSPALSVEHFTVSTETYNMA